jgi:hypothetical protein
MRRESATVPRSMERAGRNTGFRSEDMRIALPPRQLSVYFGGAWAAASRPRRMALIR